MCVCVWGGGVTSIMWVDTDVCPEWLPFLSMGFVKIYFIPPFQNLNI